MRGPVFSFYARMLPRLQAEAALERINEGTIAAGRMKPSPQREYLTELDKRMTGGRRPRRPKTLDHLAAMGIAVVSEPLPETADAASEEVSP